LLGGLALWASVALVWPIVASLSGFVMVATSLLALLLGVGALFAAYKAKEVHAGQVLAVGFAVGVLVCCLQGAALQRSMHAVESGSFSSSEESAENSSWYGELLDDPQKSSYGFRATARLWGASGASIKVTVYLPSAAEDFYQGSRFVGKGKLSAPPSAQASTYWNAGKAGVLSLSEVEKGESPWNEPLLMLRQRAISLMSDYAGDAASLLQALVCGYKQGIIDDGTYDEFKRIGLAHLVAVSGAHLSLVALMLASCLKLAQASRRTIAFVSAFFLLCYVCFTGMPVSALRAALMACSGLLALIMNKRASSLAALGLCLVLFVGLDPASGLSVSFILSAGSTLGIVLFGSLFMKPFGRKPTKLRRLVGEPCAMTLSSACATQPYAAALFSQLPLLSLPANILTTPLFTLGCLVGFVTTLVGCAFTPLAPLAFSVAGLAVTPLAVVAHALSLIPGTCLPIDASVPVAVVCSVALCAGLYFSWRSLSAKRVLACSLPVLLLCGAVVWWPATERDEIIMFDVGQGDAILIRSEGQSILIDTGNQDSLLQKACARNKLHQLQALAITHPDDDHDGSLRALFSSVVVERMVVANDLLTCTCTHCTSLRSEASTSLPRERMVGLSVGDAIRVGHFTLQVIWPTSFTDEGGNADSLTFLCTYDAEQDGVPEWRGLFCGDAEAEQVQEMIEPYLKEGVDVLKVGHHGSKKSLNEEVARALSPSIALIGVGANNRYGHPSQEVRTLLENEACEIFRTDLHGDISVQFSAEKLKVTCQNNNVEVIE
jgi:competence protein ComEC